MCQHVWRHCCIGTLRAGTLAQVAALPSKRVSCLEHRWGRTDGSLDVLTWHQVNGFVESAGGDLALAPGKNDGWKAATGWVAAAASHEQHPQSNAPRAGLTSAFYSCESERRGRGVSFDRGIGILMQVEATPDGRWQAQFFYGAARVPMTCELASNCSYIRCPAYTYTRIRAGGSKTDGVRGQ